MELLVESEGSRHAGVASPTLLPHTSTRIRAAAVIPGLPVDGAIGSRPQTRQLARRGMMMRKKKVWAQCRKCLTPVSTMAMPASSAALMTSSSRIDPPG